MKLTEKLLRKFTIQKAGKSNLLKKVASLLIFVSYFVFSTIILFQLQELPKDLKKIWTVLTIVASLIMLIQMSKISEYNIQISFNKSYLSFLMAIGMFVYAFFFVIYENDHTQKTFSDVPRLVYWIIGAIAITLTWKLLFVVVEWRTRPFFVKKQIYKVIQLIAVMILLGISVVLFSNYLIEKNKFSLNDEKMITLIITCVSLVLFIIWLEYLSYKVVKNDSNRDHISRQNLFKNSLLKTGPLTIWFASNYSVYDFNPMLIAFIAASIFLVIFILIVSIVKRNTGKESNLLLLITTSSMFVLGFIMFLEKTLWEIDEFSLALILLITYSSIFVINIIVNPKITRFYSWGFKWAISSLLFYSIALWAMNYYFSLITNIPFDLDNISIIPFLLSLTVTEFTIVLSSYASFRSMSRNAVKILKRKNKVLKKEGPNV